MGRRGQHLCVACQHACRHLPQPHTCSFCCASERPGCFVATQQGSPCSCTCAKCTQPPSRAQHVLGAPWPPAGYTGRAVDVTPICASDPGMSNANMRYVVLEVGVGWEGRVGVGWRLSALRGPCTAGAPRVCPLVPQQAFQAPVAAQYCALCTHPPIHHHPPTPTHTHIPLPPPTQPPSSGGRRRPREPGCAAAAGGELPMCRHGAPLHQAAPGISSRHSGSRPTACRQQVAQVQAFLAGTAALPALSWAAAALEAAPAAGGAPPTQFLSSQILNFK